MNILTRWKQSSVPAKSVAVLAVLLILQIGICFSAPQEQPWFKILFHMNPNPVWEDGIGAWIEQAMFWALTFVLLIIAFFVWLTVRIPNEELREKDSND